MMGSGWPTVPLGDVVTHRKEFIRISDTQEYTRCRVQLGARGIVTRDRVLGFDIKTKEQQVCRAGELLVAEIDAKLGGFGIVPDYLAGSVVSSHYFLFHINTDLINKNYLGYYIRTPEFQDQIAARGSTNYAAIRPRHVLEYVIPLPNRREQDRIAAKVDALAAKIVEACRNRHEIEQETEAMLRSAFSEIVVGVPKRRLSDFLIRRKDLIKIEPFATYKEITVRLWGKGVVLRREIEGLGIASAKRFRATEGQLIMSRIDARNGAFGLIPNELDGAAVTNDFPVFDINTDIVLPDIFAWLSRTPEFARACEAASEGTTNRVRLQEGKFLALRFPVPGTNEQMLFSRLQARAREVTAVALESQIELNAMLPSILDKAFRGEI